MGIEENKQVVRRWIEGWNTRGAEAVDELFHEDFTDTQLEQRLGTKVTLDNFKESLRALEQSLGRGQFEEAELLAEGDRVMARWTVRGTIKGSFLGVGQDGQPYALDGVNIFRVKDGRIAERWTSLDLQTALRELGAKLAPA